MPPALHQVGPVQPAGPDPDADLFPLRLRRGDLADLQGLGSPLAWRSTDGFQ